MPESHWLSEHYEDLNHKSETFTDILEDIEKKLDKIWEINSEDMSQTASDDVRRIFYNLRALERMNPWTTEDWIKQYESLMSYYVDFNNEELRQPLNSKTRINKLIQELHSLVTEDPQTKDYKSIQEIEIDWNYLFQTQALIDGSLSWVEKVVKWLEESKEVLEWILEHPEQITEFLHAIGFFLKDVAFNTEKYIPIFEEIIEESLLDTWRDIKIITANSTAEWYKTEMAELIPQTAIPKLFEKFWPLSFISVLHVKWWLFSKFKIKWISNKKWWWNKWEAMPKEERIDRHDDLDWRHNFDVNMKPQEAMKVINNYENKLSVKYFNNAWEWWWIETRARQFSLSMKNLNKYVEANIEKLKQDPSMYKEFKESFINMRKKVREVSMDNKLNNDVKIKLTDSLNLSLNPWYKQFIDNPILK